MQIFEKTIVVSKDDLDQLNHVNNVRYVQWVQDIAEAHWLQNATNSILDNVFWVLVNHQIDYKSQAVLGDQLLVKTYVTRSEGITSERIVEFINKTTDKLIVKSITKWCLLSTKTKRPKRITPEIAKLFD
ncbi:acyl-CoA thioesterase [Winogradskyella flava]|uniref:Acyl-CoA thioesterase n=1 Tax=Winogradskyella flava TaxID=1884876 RepID=A0A842IRC0_9FLAO|nr:acyl-CoA thioesterase [Winogradskyella flava]MBC2845401.1 acyl-CoA thioesterase [Winogradskyella flava]